MSDNVDNPNRLPCPHSRPDWRMCPHCIGTNVGTIREYPEAVKMARGWLASHPIDPGVADLAHAVIALHEELDRIKSTHRALEMLEPKDMTYEQRSEFDRLKHADVDQGKRIAALLADRDKLVEP